MHFHIQYVPNILGALEYITKGIPRMILFWRRDIDMSIRVRDIPHTYAEANKLLGKVNIRNVGSLNRYDRYDDRKGYQGCLIRNPGGKDIYLKLYDTVIVRYYPNGNMWVSCGSYPTKTSMGWINEALSNRAIGHVSKERLDKDDYRLVYYGNKNKYGKVLPYMIRRRK